jgi:hypothetical protein
VGNASLPNSTAAGTTPLSVLSDTLADQTVDVSRFLVASPPMWDLLLFAKHLFFAANHSKGPVLPGCPQLPTLSGCNNYRSRASRLDTNRSWE